MMSDKRVWGLFVLTLVIGCQRPGGDSEEPVIPVEVNAVEQGSVKQTLTYSGDIKAELEVKVFSKIADRIEKYYVDDGDPVRRGDPIAKVVSTTIKQAVRQAEAGLTAARAQHANVNAEHDRATRLYKENAISRQQYDAIQAQYEAVSAQLEQAEAGLATAQSQLSDATVTSPINGLIGMRYFDAGDMAGPGAPIASVVQMDRVKIEFDATEEDLGSLAVGQNAGVHVRSYSDQVFEGKILKISPVLDPMTRMATVEVLIPNPGHKLKPGMYAEVEITVGLLNDTLVVPRSSVFESTSLEDPQGERRVVRNFFVYVVNDSDRAEQRKLDVAYLNHTQVAVRSGLEAGERLVVSGQKNLREGMAVLIPEDEIGPSEAEPADVNSDEGEEVR
jgi:membrane fusion protein (multidrug efflux system)